MAWRKERRFATNDLGGLKNSSEPLRHFRVVNAPTSTPVRRWLNVDGQSEKMEEMAMGFNQLRSSDSVFDGSLYEGGSL